MATIIFKFGTLILGRQNIQGTFDADINTEVSDRTTNANLTIYIRLCFQQINPTAAVNTYNDWDNKPVPIRAWKPKEWTNWKARFLKSCQKKWNGKFWLKTPLSYDGLNWPKQKSSHRCNLYCRFEITEQSIVTGAHAVIPVVHVDGKHEFRSHALLYSNRDLEAERLTRGSFFYTNIHEIGHLIGLEHPGTGLPGCISGGEAVCYEDATGNNRGVMGMGSCIYEEHAKPWVKAAAILSQTTEADWKVSLSHIYPQSL
jgi:hypothetical protein